jgi:phosphatidylglycerol:prolipoprotein diacylglycerol transferase
MHPICLQIGNLTIHWYGVFMALAFLSGLMNWILLGKRDGRNAQFCSDLMFWVMIGGIAGGRVAYVLSDIGYYASRPIEALFLWEGGLIYYGGLIGGILAVVLFSRRRGVPGLAGLDLAMSSLPFAHALGRIGCFLNGCCFGGVCQEGLAVRFPSDSHPWWRQVNLGLITEDATQSLPVHPVQFYEAGANILIYALLVLVFLKRRRHGMVVALYLMTYPLSRFLLEFLRGTHREEWLGMPVAQAISLILIASGAALFVWLRKHPETRN